MQTAIWLSFPNRWSDTCGACIRALAMRCRTTLHQKFSNGTGFPNLLFWRRSFKMGRRKCSLTSMCSDGGLLSQNPSRSVVGPITKAPASVAAPNSNYTQTVPSFFNFQTCSPKDFAQRAVCSGCYPELKKVKKI